MDSSAFRTQLLHSDHSSMAQTSPLQMAASTSNILIPFSKTYHHHHQPTVFPSIHHTKFKFPSISLTQKSLLTITLRTPTITCNAFSNPNSSLPSITTEQHPKTSVLDFWREIHGEGDWAWLLDPMDTLMRPELIRYCEMAQACYDAFDCDLSPSTAAAPSTQSPPPSPRWPKKKVLNSQFLRVPRHDPRGLHSHALPLRHRQHQPPQLLQEVEVAPEDVEQARQLGRIRRRFGWRNERKARKGGHRLAWRGTVTRLEWVADLMNFLVPISSRGVPCPYRDVKVESGFLELYTDTEGEDVINKD